MQVIGYARLSKSSEEGHGLDVQHQAIEQFCQRRGYRLLRIEQDDGASGRSTRKRPGLQRALEACRSEGCGAIVGTRVDRLARSSLDFHKIIAEAQKAGATVLFSEQESFSLDSPEGRMLASILASFAAFEADLVSQRTKSALAHVRAHGSKSGRAIGNPSFQRVPGPVVAQICRLRDEGQSYAEIARELNRQGVTTAQGGAAWHAQTVRKIALRETEAVAA